MLRIVHEGIIDVDVRRKTCLKVIIEEEQCKKVVAEEDARSNVNLTCTTDRSKFTRRPL